MLRPSARQLALAALIVIDLGLKAAAWIFLRGLPEPLGYAGLIRLGFVRNPSGFGFDQSRLLRASGVGVSDSLIVSTLIVLLLLAAIILVWKRIRINPWLKAGLALGLYLGLACLLLSLFESVNLALPDFLHGILRALGPLAVAIALYSQAERPYALTVTTVFLAGTVGNCASLILPPFAVIDYFGIYRASISGYVYANAADLFLVVSTLGLVVYPLVRGLTWLKARCSKKIPERRGNQRDLESPTAKQ